MGQVLHKFYNLTTCRSAYATAAFKMNSDFRRKKESFGTLRVSELSGTLGGFTPWLLCFVVVPGGSSEGFLCLPGCHLRLGRRELWEMSSTSSSYCLQVKATPEKIERYILKKKTKNRYKKSRPFFAAGSICVVCSAGEFLLWEFSTAPPGLRGMCWRGSAAPCFWTP